MDKFRMKHFPKQLLFREFTYVMMKRGSPISKTVTQFLEVMYAMGFPDYIETKRLPIEAEHYGRWITNGIF